MSEDADAQESDRSRRLMSEALQKEDEFLEYLMSLPAASTPTSDSKKPPALARSTSAALATQPSKAGLDHLDNLCKLMEQLGSLKEQNTKLQRRVQYLEDLKSLQQMHKQLQHDRRPSQQQRLDNQTSETKAKVSKWTKVKEAFRWERASLVAAAEQQPKRAPSSSSSESSSEDLDVHLTFSDVFPDVGSHHGSTSVPGSRSQGLELRRLSLAEEATEEEARRSRSLDGDTLSNQLPGKDVSPLSKSPSGKVHRTPWGKVKDIIIQTRKDSLKRRTGDQETGDSVPSDLDSDALVKRAAPRLTLTLPSSEELRSPTPQDRLHKTSTSSSAAEDEDRRTHVSASPPTNRRHSSKWTKVKKAFLTPRQEDMGSGPNSPRDATSFVFPQNGDSEEVAPVTDQSNNTIQAEIQRSYEELQQKLSLEFHNKLAEWERIKGVPSATQPAAQYCGETSVLIPDHPLLRTPQDKCFRRKMEEWERLKQQNKQHDHLSADFRKKLNEWQRLKKVEPKGRRQLWERRERALSAGDSEESPRTARKGKDKELMWLEKELHKIAREKQRLERERDKFLQREARLERMRRAMRSGHEVLVQTSTGSFRFHGISETFTRRLYEWEQARGIGPEDSTFALLDPGYRPQPVPKVGQDGSDGPLLSRSKSAGSVTNMTNTLTRQASSLSLNDVEALEAATLEEARAISDPHLRSDATTDDEEGPSAVIVDVEDEVVETAAPLAVTPAIRGHTPVYCYAPREVDRFMDSSDRDNGPERESSGVQRNESVRTVNSYRLLEENMDLLEKLRNNEDICRKLEREIEDLETKMADAAHSREQQLHHLENAEEGRQVALLRARVRELERRQERLKRQGASLQDSIAAKSEQQALLASHLVGNMKQLQENNIDCAADPIAVVQELSTQLLELSEKLEAAVNSRSKGTRRHRLASGLTWLSADGFSLSVDSLEKSDSMMCRPDLGQLPALLTSKVLELKKGLNFLCPSDQADEDQRIADLAKPINQFGSSVTSDTNVSTLVPKRENEVDQEGASSTNRDSFCSAISSTSLVDSSSEDLKNEVNGEVGNDEPTVNSVERGVNIKSLVKTCSHGSTDESDNTDGEDEVDLNSNCIHEKIDNDNARHINEIPSEDVSINNSYDTEVILPIKLSKTGGRSKKLLKTRRISDTHVGYKNTDNIPCEKDTNDSDNTDDEIVSENWKEESAKEKDHARTSKHCDINSNVRKGRDASKYQKPNELEERASNIGSQFTEENIIGSKAFDEELTVSSSNLESSGESGPAIGENSKDSINAQSNVFVKTTRKIFSPVRRDSKGKTSSVISFVVGEPDGNAHSTGNRWPHRQENGDKYTSDGQNIPSPGTSMKTPPAWMLRRSRSQSSSPAMIRRRPTISTHEETTSLESCSAAQKESADENLSKETPLNKTTNFSLKEPARKLENSEDGKSSEQTADKSCSNDIQSSPGLPPMSQSPNPNRRDFLKMVSKETAPSIRMMIAKYNQKLEHSVGGRSPENVGASAGGSASPVAWRSPVTERRVRTQMEKYQEEVRRALEQGNRKCNASRVEVQKSASAGFIPNSQTNKNCSENFSKPPSVTVQRSGILKSSSAGCIKPAFSTYFLQSGNSDSSRAEDESKPILSPPELFKDAPKVSATSGNRESKFPKFPSATTSTSSPSSPELGMNSAEKSPPLSRLRALRLKRAKEEFLTRGPGSQSWSSDVGTPAVSDDVKRSRLSQISVCSSESDSSKVTLRNSNPKQEEDETQILQKSASAGMINVEDGPRIVENAKTNSKFGIASIASRFRKVKMRKNRNESNKMNTVSALCRQSLLVDLGERSRERVAAPSSKSCPSSPVLQRPSTAPSSTPNSTATNDDDSRTSCWVKKKIFGPRC